MSKNRATINFLKAMAHPARLRILNALRDDEECVCHLTALLRQRQAYISQQLMFLRQAGLIEDRKDGLRVYYRIKDPRILDVLNVVNALVGEKDGIAERQVLATCPCPRCEKHGQRIGARQRKPKSLIRVAPTVSN